MEKILACPKHGRSKGHTFDVVFNEKSKYHKLANQTAWKCDECKTYYISTKECELGLLDAKPSPNERIVNEELLTVLPNKVYLYNKYTREGYCGCNNIVVIDKFIDSSKKIVGFNLKYCPTHDRFYFEENNYHFQVNFFKKRGIKVINYDEQEALSNEENENSLINENVQDAKKPECESKYIDINTLHKPDKIAKAYNSAKIDYNPYQFLPWLYMYVENKSKLLISDEVGLGKTIEAGIIIDEELENNASANILVICPAFLKNKWKEELREKFFLNPIIYGENKDENLSKITILPLSKLQPFNDDFNDGYDLIIIDEVHYFKNNKSKRYKYLEKLLIANYGARLVFMSATPINNTENDYRSIANLFGGKHYTTSTTKKQAFIKLARRNVEDIFVQLDDYEQELYNTTDCLDPFSGTIYRHIGASCLYSLIKYATRESLCASETKEELNDAIMELIDGEFNEEEYAAFYESISKLDVPKTDSKLNKLVNLIENIDDEKIIIFTHYIETVKYLHSSLSNNYNCGFIYANKISDNIDRLSKNGFDDAKRWFNEKRVGNKTILICSDSCKEGIDLQTASCLINYDLPFNPSILEQRIGRIDRKGQNNDMRIYNFHVDDTYDDRLHYILQEKLLKINYFANHGIGNPLTISSEKETTLDKFIRYYKKNKNIKTSEEDLATIKKMLRKCNIKYSASTSKDEFLDLLEYNKSLIISLFDDEQLDSITDEELELQKQRLDNLLGFPTKKQGIYAIDSRCKENIAKRANSDLSFRNRISNFIIGYEEKLAKVEDTGVPMDIDESDIKDEVIFSSNIEDGDNFISTEIAKLIE